MWIVTALSIFATVANIHKKTWCFHIWLVTNTLWMLYDWYIGATAQSALFAVYVILAVYGIYQWRYSN
jgi:nicotinamide riboside transporter PnuC